MSMETSDITADLRFIYVLMKALSTQLTVEMVHLLPPHRQRRSAADGINMCLELEVGANSAHMYLRSARGPRNPYHHDFTGSSYWVPSQSLAPMLVVTILNQFDYEKLKDNFTASEQSTLQDLHGIMFYLICLTPMCIAFLQILAWTPYSIRDSHTDFA
eukprot:g40505.t1